jgi:cyclic-di-GMP-binding protein
MNALSDKFSARLARMNLFGRGNDDPLTNLKTATRWSEHLPAGDPVKSQDAYVKELRRFNDNLTDFSKDRLSVLMVLDEKSRDLQDTLVRQYLRNPRMSRAVESQLWHAIYSLYWEVARGYHLFVREFSRHAKKCSYENLIPLLTLRAIRNFGLLLKWRAVRYLQPGEKLWLRLHSLYRVAESEGFQQLVQQAYPEETLRCTCETTYIHALMLDLANSGTLYPRQIDLVDRWLFGWHASFKLENRLNADQHNFVVDLSVDSGPRRARTPDDNAAKRYWSTGTLLLRLEEIKAEIQRGTSPAMLGLSEDARTAEAMDLLKHLEHQWAALSSREQRRAPRIPTKRMLDVTHGLGNVLTQLKTASGHTSASPYDTGLDYMEANDVRIYGYVTEQTRERTTLMKAPVGSKHGEVERWVMNDESESGYGSIVETQDKDWLRVGTLVGVKSQEGHGWRVGMIRRLSRLNDESSSVGIEILASDPNVVMLYDTRSSGYTVDGFDNTGAQLPIASLWLPVAAGSGSLIIDPAHFQSGKVFMVEGIEGEKYIRLGHPLEHSEGWMHVTAELVQG